MNVYILLLDINLGVHLAEISIYTHEKASTPVHSSTILNRVKQETIQMFNTEE